MTNIEGVPFDELRDRHAVVVDFKPISDDVTIVPIRPVSDR